MYVLFGPRIDSDGRCRRQRRRLQVCSLNPLLGEDFPHAGGLRAETSAPPETVKPPETRKPGPGNLKPPVPGKAILLIFLILYLHLPGLDLAGSRIDRVALHGDYVAAVHRIRVNLNHLVEDARFALVGFVDDADGSALARSDRPFGVRRLETRTRGDDARHDQRHRAVVGEGETILAERISFAPQPQSSMVIIDQHTGYVKALVGGRGEKTASLTLNRATDTYRQPGSTFKPLAVYGPAINDLGLTLADTYVDQAITYENTNRPVKNAYSGYRGTMTIRDALKYSCNTIAVQCFRDVTPRLGYTYLKDLGFEKVTDHEVINGQVFDDAREPTALGGITNGVSTLELTAAYAAIANGGTYTKPVFYTKILDQNGDVILENKPKTTEVFRESTAYLLTSALESVVNDEGGTGNGLKLDNMPVAGKTGTTSATRDVWFAGFTPYYTCAVWAGYDTNEFLEDDCKSFHKNLWKKVMGRIHADLPYVDFEIPSTVKQATICTSSGLLAGSGCPTRTEYFETSTIPTVRCTRHYVAPTPPPLPSPEASPSDSESNTDGDTTSGETTDSATGDGTATDAGAGATPSDTGGTGAAPPDASAPAAGGDPATPDTGGQDAAPAT